MTRTMEATRIPERPSSARERNRDEDFEIVTVTPEMAAEWLDRAATRSPADSRAIDTYKKLMEAGAWLENGQPLIFDENGRLLDGVQRLHACIAANTPFITAIAKNVRADTLHTIDQHRKRLYTGVLESRGYKNAGAILRTMSKLIRIENGVLGKEFRQISWFRYDRVLAANPELQEAVEMAEQFSRSEIHSTPRPVLAFMAIKAGYMKEIRAFLGDTIQDETHGNDNAAKRLAFQLSSARATSHDPDDEMTLAISILAFNDYLEGKVRNKPYSWKPDFGKVKIDPSTGLPYDRKAMRTSAPANLGLPVMTGEPQLDDGRFDVKNFEVEDALSDQMLHDLRKGRDPKGVQIFYLTVTPEMARDWLANYNRDNRKIQRSHINMIARDIEKGQWMVNAQPICFTGNPLEGGEGIRLLNGQHRLYACVTANTDIEVPIAINIPKEAFATYDTHHKKSPVTDESSANARNLNAAARFQWRVDNGMSPLSRESPSATDIRNTVQAHPEMIEAMNMARRKEFDEIGPTGMMTFFIYNVLREGGKDLGGHYLEQLSSGVGIEEGNPVLRVTSKVKGQRGNIPRRDALKALLDNWEDYKEWASRNDDATRQANLI